MDQLLDTQHSSIDQLLRTQHSWTDLLLHTQKCQADQLLHIQQGVDHWTTWPVSVWTRQSPTKAATAI
jgi:hypothetical protein